jgi:hypothetical protein
MDVGMIDRRWVVALALLLGACSAPAPEADSLSRGREKDAGSGDDTPGATAGPATSDGGGADAAPVLEGPSAPFGKPVRFVYLIPSDKTQKPSYVQKITRAAAHLQAFYRSELAGKTFSVHSTVVEMHQTTHPASWYSTNAVVGVPMLERWQDNATKDGFALTGAKYDDPDYVWLFYVDADNACGQKGGAATSHVGAFPSNDLRGLANEPKIPTCSSDPPEWYDTPPCRWVGGMGHELGHAFGLPHPPGCEEDQASCDASSIMWTGVYEYPKTYFNAAERAQLAASPFVKTGASASNFDCNQL